jgi:hypothetical protein
VPATEASAFWYWPGCRRASAVETRIEAERTAGQIEHRPEAEAAN